jgi:LmbE family N-acetylglucosaminyl deacetylase
MTQPIRPAQARRHGSAHAKLFGTGPLNRSLHCAVIVAHPADEIVGAGCLISKLGDVSVLHTTDGAPKDLHDARAAGFETREDYAAARREECLAALALANVSKERVIDLAVTADCAAECLTELTRRIATFLQQTSANIVVTHPYEGAHPDHDATAFATHAALRLLKKNGFRPPAVFEMALHPGLDSLAKVPEFLPGSAAETTTLLLDERSQLLKQEMFACFETQRESLKVSPIGPERFRQPVNYDFRLPPAEGKLYYEDFEWAAPREQWQNFAREAWADLFPAASAAKTNNSH